MTDHDLRLGTSLCMLALALAFVIDMVTLGTPWRRRRRPRGCEYNQKLGVLIALGMLGVCVALVVVTLGVVI